MTSLPLLPPTVVKGSLNPDGTRDRVYPADVRGKFRTARTIVYLALVSLWALLPSLPIHGRPALLVDVSARQFLVFGLTFNAQDVWLLFFVLSGIGFGLIYVTAWLGRVFCGWACPQTVFLDLLYRRVERWINGPREAAKRRDAGPWNADRMVRAVTTYAAYALLSIGLSIGTTRYFIPAHELVAGIVDPLGHMGMSLWIMTIAATLAFNFGYFREQLCLAICPYGRLQSAMIDGDTVTIAYDQRRGEPRGKVSAKADQGLGDCVDCKRCVVVCPTGIDIRNGLQLDCVACTACIDACDEIMDRLDRPRGLIRYASSSSLAGGKTRWVRPRTLVYTALLLAGSLAASLAFGKHASFEANLLRLPGPPYVFEGETIRDSFEVHLVNKTGATESYKISAETDSPGVSFVVALPTVKLEPMQGIRVPVLVTLPRSSYTHDFPIRVGVRPASGAEERALVGQFLGAKKGG
jgi:cytochrome c oxidase accessory protein FixG